MPRPVLVLMVLSGAAGALVLGTLETDAASAYWHARPGLEHVGPALLIASLLSLLAGTTGLVVQCVGARRSPAIDSPRPLVVRTAWAGWALVGAATAFAVVLVGELLGLLLIAAAGGCGGISSWCGFGTAVLALGAGVATTVLAAVGGGLLAWSRRAAARAGGAWR